MRHSFWFLIVVVVALLLAGRLFRHTPYVPAVTMEAKRAQAPDEGNRSRLVPLRERNESAKAKSRGEANATRSRPGQGANRSDEAEEMEVVHDSRKLRRDPEVLEFGEVSKPTSEPTETNESRGEARPRFGVPLAFLKPKKMEENDTMSGDGEEETLQDRIEGIGAEMGDPITIRIFKTEGVLEIWMEVEGSYRFLKSYPVCRYSGDLGPKLKEGDGQSPEGFYAVTLDRLNPNSRYRLAMNIGYPNAYDRAHHRTGSYIMIHGGCVSVGCYAMGDEAIEEIYELTESALENGQMQVMVQIFPFRMETERMETFRDHRWYDFWENIREGYEIFEKERRLPVVQVKEGRYLFR